jgi:hypothetical protein
MRITTTTACRKLTKQHDKTTKKQLPGKTPAETCALDEITVVKQILIHAQVPEAGFSRLHRSESLDAGSKRGSSFRRLSESSSSSQMIFMRKPL